MVTRFPSALAAEERFFKEDQYIIRKKLDKAERLMLDCDLRAVDELVKIEKMLVKYDGYSLERFRPFGVLLSDVRSVRNELILGCVCTKKE